MLRRLEVALPPKLADLFDTVAYSGKRGVTKDTLVWVHYPSRSRAEGYRCVIQNIHRINDLLVQTNYRIRGTRFESYRLVLESD